LPEGNFFMPKQYSPFVALAFLEDDRRLIRAPNNTVASLEWTLDYMMQLLLKD